MSRRLAALFLSVFAVVVVACTGAGGPGDPAGTEPRAPRQTPKADPVTMAKYNRIKTGDHINDVREVMGTDGVEQSRNKFGGVETVMCLWQNPDGSNMNVIVQNGWVTSKAQFGLR